MSDSSPSFTEDELRETIADISEDPVLFSKLVLKMEPFPYQAEFLKDRSIRIVVCAGRQVGKSFITSARVVWHAITHPHTTTLIVSATLRQSSLMFDKILEHVSSSRLIENSVKRKTRTKVVFTNKSEIIALPCGRFGKSIRGHTAHLVVLDEAAFIPNEVITEAVLPMISTTNGGVIMLSTPFDRDHIFFKAFQRQDWSKYHFPSSVNPKITKKFLDEMLDLVGPQQFAQEYLAEFVDDSSAYFPMALLRSCLHVCPDNAKMCEFCEIYSGKSKLEGESYAGYDPGGSQDPAALVIVRKSVDGSTHERIFQVVLTKTFRRPDKRTKDEKEGDADENLYSRINVEISDIRKKYPFRKMFVDSTGLGSPIVEHCKELGLPAESYAIHARSKEELLSNLRLLLEQKKLVLPNDINLLSNLNCIETKRSGTGGFLFDHKRGTHDDLAFALALAVWAGKVSGTIIMMKPDLLDQKLLKRLDPARSPV